MVNLTINEKNVSVPEGTTILEAAASVGIRIPSLCYLKDVHKFGACRICTVEVEGAKNLQASCITAVTEGMVVKTNTPRVRAARKMLYELMISDHPQDCLNCVRNGDCELRRLGSELGIDSQPFSGESGRCTVDISPSITRDNAKCILCRRCVTVCREVQCVGAIDVQNRGFASVISPVLGLPLNSTACAMCGQCTVVCPTGALRETDGISAVWSALDNAKQRVVVQVAPAVRSALGEEFGLPAGTAVTGQMVTALRELGFDDVFDTNFAADMTILEEGTELLERVKSVLTGGSAVLPMITSCSPGWIKHIEHEYPNELDHLSTCKSPHTMFGALVKSYYAEKLGLDPGDIFVVSVMPCTAKKYEIQRPEMENGGHPNVDAVITTRELARMIRSSGIDFFSLPESDFDAPLGLSTGAADLFGVTGGVMEAALRTVYEFVTGRELPFEGLRVAPIEGFEQIKDVGITFEDVLPEYSFLEGVTVRVAVTSGLAGSDILMRQVREGVSPYHFIEVMGCPGGCITGGGQPRSSDENIREKRAKALYGEDERKTLHKSHENAALLQVYEEYFDGVGGHKAHDLLHTVYTPRGRYNELL